jgi:hypothetical protein
MQHQLTCAVAALLLAACGGSKGDQRVNEGEGPLSAPVPGEGGGVNGNGMTDRNAALPADSSGTGAPSSSGISTSGTSTSVGGPGAPGAGPATGTVKEGTPTAGNAGGAGASGGAAGGGAAGGAGGAGARRP